MYKLGNHEKYSLNNTPIVSFRENDLSLNCIALYENGKVIHIGDRVEYYSEKKKRYIQGIVVEIAYPLFDITSGNILIPGQIKILTFRENRSGAVKVGRKISLNCSDMYRVDEYSPSFSRIKLFFNKLKLVDEYKK